MDPENIRVLRMGWLHGPGCIDPLVGVPCPERTILVVQKVLPDTISKPHIINKGWKQNEEDIATLVKNRKIFSRNITDAYVDEREIERLRNYFRMTLLSIVA